AHPGDPRAGRRGRRAGRAGIGRAGGDARRDRPRGPASGHRPHRRADRPPRWRGPGRMTAARACRVARLRLYRFRNYAEQVVELGPGLNVVSGPNAQGKTNLLEAVATLALTRSPRAASAA